MGPSLSMWLCALLTCYAAPSCGYPRPQVQEKNSTLEMDLMMSSSDSESVMQPARDDSSDEDDPALESEQAVGQTQIVEQQAENFFTPEPLSGSQNFFPSFQLFNNPPLGHSRPFLFQQEAAYSQRPGPYRQQQLYDNTKYNNPFRRENFQAAVDTTQSLLGSGNFGVIRGGTFYNENENSDLQDYSTGRYNNFAPYYQNNGHGRPSFYFGANNPRPHQHDQFANFRDFADINTPNSAYSQYVVVYVNRNGSSIEKAPPPKKAEPKNIIERLAMLDLEAKKANNAPAKKLSAFKRKLALLPPEKKIKLKTTTATPPSDLYEPLLALS